MLNTKVFSNIYGFCFDSPRKHTFGSVNFDLRNQHGTGTSVTVKFRGLFCVYKRENKRYIIN